MICTAQKWNTNNFEFKNESNSTPGLEVITEPGSQKNITQNNCSQYRLIKTNSNNFIKQN